MCVAMLHANGRYKVPGSPMPQTTPWIRTAMGIHSWTRSGSSQSILEPKPLTTNGGYAIAHILPIFLIFMGCLATANAMNLANCGEGLKNAHDTAWNATNSTSPPPKFHLSYEQCVAECGGGIGDINLEASSQSFGAWFLPWIALMFQIPFGAECKWYIHISSPFGVLTRCPQVPSKMS